VSAGSAPNTVEAPAAGVAGRARLDLTYSGHGAHISLDLIEAFRHIFGDGGARRPDGGEDHAEGQ